MTGQEPDRFYYKDQRLDLVGIKGKNISVPESFGIKTYSRSTNCWRGYIMRYKIIGNELVLDGFWFNSEDDNLPEINNVKPVKTPDIKPESITESEDWMSFMFEYEYKDVNMRINFKGSLWLARDFIRSEYVHMGFQSPTAYRTVLKFDFKDGIIINVEDKSKDAEKARQDGSCKAPQPKSMSSNDLEEWIMERFSLDIDSYKKKENGEEK
jgi:hypothetical protein